MEAMAMKLKISFSHPLITCYLKNYSKTAIVLVVNVGLLMTLHKTANID